METVYGVKSNVVAESNGRITRTFIKKTEKFKLNI